MEFYVVTITNERKGTTDICYDISGREIFFTTNKSAAYEYREWCQRHSCQDVQYKVMKVTDIQESTS